MIGVSVQSYLEFISAVSLLFRNTFGTILSVFLRLLSIRFFLFVFLRDGERERDSQAAPFPVWSPM